MKKKIAIIIVSALLIPVNCSSAFSEVEYIKVGLAFGNTAVSSFTVRCEDGFLLAGISEGGYREIQKFPDSRELTVSIKSGRIFASDGGGATLFDDFSTDMCLLPVSGVLTYNNRPYRGGICLNAQANGRMNVINHIALEEYLYGVLNSEMGYHNPSEALKAQAVTARSFAVSNREKHESEGFNLCADVHCQVYKGYSDEHKDTNRAVDDTLNLTLIYGGKPVSGYYFKNSGGHTLSAEEVWGGKMPYLIGVKDDYSPDYTWNHSLSFQEARGRLEAAGHNIGTVKSVKITGRSLSGAVSSLEFQGTSGTVELKRENIRTVFGGTNVRSLAFSFGSGHAVVSDVIHVLGAYGKIEKLRPKDVYVISANGLAKLADHDYSANESVEQVSAGPIVFHGVGYGHGVGMPQDSAIAMAKQGFSFEEILKYFYTGVEIQ